MAKQYSTTTKRFIILSFGIAFLAFTALNFVSPPSECPPEGKGKKGKLLTAEKKAFNKKKNRSSAEPDKSADAYSINDLLQGRNPVHDKDKFEEGTYVEISDGYLMSSDEQGPEDCNCHQGKKSKKTGDVHINLCNTTNLKDKNKDFTVIVEITPSYKRLHENYSESLKSLKGKKVTVRGYLFYDDEHWENSVNYCDKCSDRGVWRKTCWEIHPVTYIGETR